MARKSRFTPEQFVVSAMRAPPEVSASADKLMRYVAKDQKCSLSTARRWLYKTKGLKEAEQARLRAEAAREHEAKVSDDAHRQLKIEAQSVEGAQHLGARLIVQAFSAVKEAGDRLRTRVLADIDTLPGDEALKRLNAIGRFGEHAVRVAATAQAMSRVLLGQPTQTIDVNVHSAAADEPSDLEAAARDATLLAEFIERAKLGEEEAEPAALPAPQRLLS